MAAMGTLRDILSWADYVGDASLRRLKSLGLSDEAFAESINKPNILAESFAKADPVGFKQSLQSSDRKTAIAGYSQMSSLAHWCYWGKQVIEVSPHLAAALAMTEVKEGIPRNLPYGAFIISLPNTPIFYAGNTATLPVSAVLVSLNLQYVLESSHMSITEGTWKERVEFYALNRMVASMSAYHGKADSQVHGSWEPGRNWENDAKDELEELDISASAMMFRLIANLAMYVTEKVEGEKRPSSRRIHGLKEKISITKLGSNVMLPSALMEHVKAGSKDPAYKLHSRFAVRGHWRNQPCGEGNKETKHIWIKPFWKGPETGEQLKRMYRVDSSATE